MHGVNLALASRGLTVEATRSCAKNTKVVASPGAYVDDCVFMRPFLVPVLSGLKTAMMLLHDTVGLNCERGTTTDIKASVPSM